MSAQPRFHQPWMSIDDYLAAELISDTKHEYFDGQVYAMAGASVNHERIVMNIARILGNHLDGKPCEPFSANFKIKVGNHLFYPDAMVVCDDTRPHEVYTETPILIVEVLSRSTRRIDETLKRRLYQTIPTLQEYVLIEQDIVDIEICRRGEGWVSNHYFLGDQVAFESIDLTIDVAELYARVENDDVKSFMDERQAAGQS